MATNGDASRRWAQFVLAAVVLLVVGAAGGWAIVTVLRPVEDPLAATEHTYVRVTAGSVGASISLNTVAEWSQTPLGSNQAIGIVTAVGIDAGAEVSQGSTLYTVDLRPVIVAQGDVPMFRPISAGAAGPDVQQLQEMLRTLGHYKGAIDGKAGQETATAISRWQGVLGVTKTGIVDIGDLIFVPQLPARVSLDVDLIHRGVSLAGGENAVLGLPAAPRFWIPVTEGQAALMPVGTAVNVTTPEGQIWHGATGEQASAEDGSVSVVVTGPDGQALCADACSSIPASGQTSLRSEVVTVEQVQGLTVPSAAIVTTAVGKTALIDANNERIPVDIVTSAKGMSVVTGVAEGTRVRIPAKGESGE